MILFNSNIKENSLPVFIISLCVFLLNLSAAEAKEACISEGELNAASSDILSASVTSLELLEIVQRIDRGEVASARSLADSYLRNQVLLIEQLSETDVTDLQRKKGLDVVSRVRKYMALSEKGQSD